MDKERQKEALVEYVKQQQLKQQQQQQQQKIRQHQQFSGDKKYTHKEATIAQHQQPYTNILVSSFNSCFVCVCVCVWLLLV